MRIDRGQPTPESAAKGGQTAAEGLAKDAQDATGRVAFVHMTDPHLFDAGELRHRDGVEEEALDNRAALHWAVLETNRLVLTEGRTIDFVVVAGDFGLNNVILDGVPKDSPKCECPKRRPDQEGPIAAVPLAEAAREVARQLNALVVKRVLLVPGEADLCDEHPRDLHRWAAFVHALRQAADEQWKRRAKDLHESYPRDGNRDQAPPRLDIVDLTYSLEELYASKDPHVLHLFAGTKGPDAAEPLRIKGIDIVGLNSAFFRPHADAATQRASEAASLKELVRVRDRIVAGTSYLLFTHIADAPEPAPPVRRVVAAASSADATSSWKLTPEARGIWRSILERRQVIGVFAGHFHGVQRETYPHDFSYVKSGADRLVAEKIWLAPPLAAKQQISTPPDKTARGMLLVSVTTTGAVSVMSPASRVTSVPLWYGTLDQKAAAEGDDKLTRARADALAGDWESAAARYQDGLTSVDSRVRASAVAGYDEARAKTRTWWWEAGRFVPGLRWGFAHKERALIFALLFVALFPTFLVLRALRFLYVGRLIKKVLQPRYRGGPRLNATIKMTTDAPADVFLAQMVVAAEEIRQLLSREQGNWLAGHVTLLAPSGTSLKSLVESIPSIQGVKVSEWLKFFVELGQAFRWNVDSGLAVLPSDGAPVARQGAVAERGQFSAYAVLQWGGMEKNSWRRIVPYDRDSKNEALADLARKMAGLVVGEAIV